MEIKVYLNKNFPVSLIDPAVNITSDLNYAGSIVVEYDDKVQNVLEAAFKKLQLEDLEIKLPRSISVGDVLSVKNYWENETGIIYEMTQFWMINNVGFKLL